MKPNHAVDREVFRIPMGTVDRAVLTAVGDAMYRFTSDAVDPVVWKDKYAAVYGAAYWTGVVFGSDNPPPPHPALDDFLSAASEET